MNFCAVSRLPLTSAGGVTSSAGVCQNGEYVWAPTACWPRVSMKSVQAARKMVPSYFTERSDCASLVQTLSFGAVMSPAAAGLPSASWVASWVKLGPAGG